MRPLRISAAALLASPVLALTAPVAVADSVTAPGVLGGPVASFGFSVTPSSAAPGATITLRATGCAARPTAGASALFATAPLTVADGPGQSAKVTLPAGARPGTRYDITFTCGNEQGTTPLTVIPPSTPATTVRTSLGSGLSGPDAAEVILGAGLVGTAGVLIFRRARTHP
ncbi:hypothetical protein [Streptomyces sp. NPDC020917]|uniref:hypothetical protein n=1 Tax=Streptomyces sp. NPDC020917 TaxID=3365102 RepID=UPI0037B60F92